MSYWHVEELMEERGVSVDHAIIQRWVVKYSPQIEAALHRRKRPVCLLLLLARPLWHRRITGRSGMRRMQGLHERHQRCDLRRAQILAIGRHIAPALDHLPDQLVPGQARCHVVECRAALAATAVQAMAIPALLVL